MKIEPTTCSNIGRLQNLEITIFEVPEYA